MSSGAPARSRARNKPSQYRGRGRGNQSSNSNNNRNSQPRVDKRVSPLETALDKSAATTVEARTFAELGLPAAIVNRLAVQGITTPTDVQNRTIPDALTGADILGRAQTGSGKTLAFGLPMVVKLAAEDRPSSPGHPRALVLAPTRELAQQVADSVGAMANSLNLSVVAVYGGASMDRQVKALRRGVDIVVATPGRLEDHIRRGTCNLSRVNTFVIDEADHMADLGFLPAVTRIIDAIPASAQRMLFSATLDRGIEKLATQHLTDPAIHAAAVGTPAAETMEHRAFTLDSTHKLDVAAKVASRHGRTLFFVRTKHGADRLAKQLRQRGIETESIHGNRSQGQRQRALADFASGRRPVLVATDVAARGIHVDDVDLVVHFDPPADHKDYLHRSGRTARAGREGLVLSLLLPHEASKHRSMHRDTGSDHHAVSVHPDHPEVMEIASGGTPIEITITEQAATDSDRPTRNPRARQSQRRGDGPREGGRGRAGGGRGYAGGGGSRKSQSSHRHQGR